MHAFVCRQCLLVQLGEFVAPGSIFGDGEYAYFSSFSPSWLAHAKAYSAQMTERARELRRMEIDKGMRTLAYYEGFSERVHETKRKLLNLLGAQKRAGKQIVGYGAPGKGNTLLILRNWHGLPGLHGRSQPSQTG